MFNFKEPLLDRPNYYKLSEIAYKSGFKFRDIQNCKLDWKALGCVDVNKIIENQDYEFLEKITPKIIEAPMQSILGTAAIDPAVSSLFRLAQLDLQYMHFCQQFMSHTLYDLRTAFNHMQKKYSNLKQNYKCLEEQHYKSQERIELLLREIKCQQNEPSSLYPCDQCTKNFLTLDSLKSHHQRKHTVIAEKHELSDDNEKEKENIHMDKKVLMDEINLNSVKQSLQDNIMTPTKNISDSNNQNNNNNDIESNKNCTECFQKTAIKSSDIAIQCEAIIRLNEHDEPFEETKLEKNALNNDNRESGTLNTVNSHIVTSAENELIQNAYETIRELKNEIIDLKNSIEAKSCMEESAQSISLDKYASLIEANDKIDVFEQKFNAFEVMLTESQHQFIESFRNLDARQKIYMNNIQETIKDVEIYLHEFVSKSIKNNNTIDEEDNSLNAKTTIDTKQCEEKNMNNELNGVYKHDNTEYQKSENTPLIHKFEQDVISCDSSSYSEDDKTKSICHAEIHTMPINESTSNDECDQDDLKNMKKKSVTLEKQTAKDVAFTEFQQRLCQIGVQIDSTGLPTPRSSEINEELVDEREEIKKANNEQKKKMSTSIIIYKAVFVYIEKIYKAYKSFEVTRNKLKNDVNRIAQSKYASASSLTSKSSFSYQSDDQILENSDETTTTTTHLNRKIRPLSASVRNQRKRNAKKFMKKFVENDINENDILDKMQMAQKAIYSHRECIQQLLQTTAHSTNSIAKLKYSNENSKRSTAKTEETNARKIEPGINQYNQMPNVTTRRVVFVNLDEDS